jgi:hypothetical protein
MKLMVSATQRMYCFNPHWSCTWRAWPVHQIVDALLSMMIRKINRGTQSVTPTTSGSSNSSRSALDDAVMKLKVPTWDISYSICA